MAAKHIFVTGGVVSGLGKGISAASLGRLLKQRGVKVAAQKLDPYVNVDPGTMSPYQHGEVFVTQDGVETDLDLGHYERFIDEDLNRLSNLTSGRVYWNVLHKERAGDYLGRTVQIIPHVTDEIKSFIYGLGSYTGADVVITEIGGTIGDIESQPFLEAIRQISREAGRENCMFLHVVLVPYLKCSGEHKTKPAQHSVHELQSMGIMPDVIIARCDEPLEDGILQKLAAFCNVAPECVIENRTLKSLYDVPLMLHEAGLDGLVCRRLGLRAAAGPDLAEWRAMCARIAAAKGEVTIAMVGKYVELHDAYFSVVEALHHGGYACGRQVKIRWVDAEALGTANVDAALAGVQGVLVPGGFGARGIEGMVLAAQYARVHGVPYLGICLGMQVAVMEAARSLAGIEGAGSREFTPENPHCVIDLMPDQQGNLPKGGTMRLGAYPCRLAPGSLLARIYGEEEILERHRHRYEVCNEYRAALEAAGVRLSGLSPDGRLVEAMEYPAHPFFVGVQYHPEFKSRPNRAHPLFRAFVAAAAAQGG